MTYSQNDCRCSLEVAGRVEQGPWLTELFLRIRQSKVSRCFCRQQQELSTEKNTEHYKNSSMTKHHLEQYSTNNQRKIYEFHISSSVVLDYNLKTRSLVVAWRLTLLFLGIFRLMLISMESMQCYAMFSFAHYYFTLLLL